MALVTRRNNHYYIRSMVIEHLHLRCTGYHRNSDIQIEEIGNNRYNLEVQCNFPQRNFLHFTDVRVEHFQKDCTHASKSTVYLRRSSVPDYCDVDEDCSICVEISDSDDGSDSDDDLETSTSSSEEDDITESDPELYTHM